MEALAIVEGSVELDVGGLWDMAEVLHINVAQAAEFGVDGAEHGVVRMAGIAGMIAGNEIVLKMRGWDVAGIIDVEASAKIDHDVAGEAELGAGGTLHVFRVSQPNGQYRQDEERHKGQNLAAARSREFGASGHQDRQCYGDSDEKYFDEHGIYHLAEESSESSLNPRQPNCNSGQLLLTGHF
jgi:hypothetical protein